MPFLLVPYSLLKHLYSQSELIKPYSLIFIQILLLFLKVPELNSLSVSDDSTYYSIYNKVAVVIAIGVAVEVEEASNFTLEGALARRGRE